MANSHTTLTALAHEIAGISTLKGLWQWGNAATIRIGDLKREDQTQLRNIFTSRAAQIRFTHQTVTLRATGSVNHAT